MKFLTTHRRTLLLLAVLAPLLLLLAYVALRTGPLAAVPVTVTTVENRAITPALFGIGTVQARYTTKIGPTVSGRVLRLDVHVGDAVQAGQVLGAMDPVDMDQRIRAQQSSIGSAEAQLRQTRAQRDFAASQLARYAKLLPAHLVSEELVASRQQELKIAEENERAAREGLNGAHATLAALRAQRGNLTLVASVAGLIVVRDADPGTTVVAGAPVFEMIDPRSLWIDTRFDQLSATGLAANLPAHIVLRSRSNQTLVGRVLRVEPVADAVTEETLAKIVFVHLPQPLPPIGELADVTVALPALPPRPTVPNASLQRIDGKLGVWRVAAGKLEFAPVKVLGSDLDGQVQVEGLKAGERVVVYSQRTLGARSNISIVDRIPGVSP
jgi:HlyD family secretion protein